MPDSFSLMPDRLSSLPVECLRPIIASLDRKELKALRSANRKLCTLASEIIFDTITVSTNDASFAQLLNIAASEFWSAQVRHIDWVSLYPYDPRPLVKFNQSWSKTLRMWDLGPSRDPFWYGLLLQCQLIQRMPNVQTVRFWKATNPLLGKERWPDDSTSDATASTTVIAMKQFVPEDSDLRYTLAPAPENMFSVLQHSALRPRLIMTFAATWYLKYSKKQELERVTILPRLDHLRQNSQELESTETLQTWKAYLSQRAAKKLKT